MSVTYLEEWRKKQELISESPANSQSKQIMPWDSLGVTHTESIDFNDDVEQLVSFWLVLDKAAREPFTVKSNFARNGAWYVAVCASSGLITTQIEDETVGKKWMITEEGFEFMEGIDERIKELL